jgi:hypothetical protein
MTDREKLLRRIKALLNKTVASGCSVDEALAALAKVRELIDMHGVTDAELQSFRASFYGFQKSPPPPPPPPGGSSFRSLKDLLSIVVGGWAFLLVFVVFVAFVGAGVLQSFNHQPPPFSQPTPPPASSGRPFDTTGTPDIPPERQDQQQQPQPFRGRGNYNPYAGNYGTDIHGQSVDIPDYPAPSDAEKEWTQDKPATPPYVGAPQPAPPATIQPKDKFVAAEDEYVSYIGTCRAGYDPVPWIDRLRCMRCPRDYSWDAQNLACRLGTSFRGEVPPDERPTFMSKEVLERQALPAMLDRMLQALSKFRGDEEYLKFVANVYTENVTYYGKVRTRQEVLEDKRNFLKKWPDRSYSIRPESLTAVCTLAGDICTATGIVDFIVSTGAKRIIGSADFKYGMQARDLSGFRDYLIWVSNEDGKVLERYYEIVSADGSTCPDGYDAILHHKAGDLYCRLRQ